MQFSFAFAYLAVIALTVVAAAAVAADILAIVAFLMFIQTCPVAMAVGLFHKKFGAGGRSL